MLLVGDEERWHHIFYVDGEGNYWDEITGKILDAEEVQRARLEEMRDNEKHRVYVKKPI